MPCAHQATTSTPRNGQKLDISRFPTPPKETIKNTEHSKQKQQMWFQLSGSATPRRLPKAGPCRNCTKRKLQQRRYNACAAMRCATGSQRQVNLRLEPQPKHTMCRAQCGKRHKNSDKVGSIER